MNIDKDNIIRLVGAMRNAQKRYFRERTQDALIASKQLEKQVDDALEGK